MMSSLIINRLSIKLRSGSDNLVSEISFAIKEGESLILLGQSGSGKTMTCSAVLNLLDPKKFEVSGSVFFGETDLLNSSEKQRRGIYGNQIVYIPQNPMTALDPSMRIGRQMDETLQLHSDKSRQQRYNYILRLLHDVGLDDPDRVYRALVSCSSNSTPANMQDVLKGKQLFYYAANDGSDFASVNIADIPSLFNPDDAYMAIQNYAMIDLDGDGSEEAVVFVCGVTGDTGGYLVLHSSDDLSLIHI